MIGGIKGCPFPVQCFILPGKWSTSERFCKRLSQQKILNLNELAKVMFIDLLFCF